MRGYRKTIGDFGENLALKFLHQRGYTIIARNYLSRYGELDIIAVHPKDINTLCCIEVKTRLSVEFGSPEEAVTPSRVKKMHAAACCYFRERRIEDKFFRLDIISIFINAVTRSARIKHLRGIQ